MPDSQTNRYGRCNRSRHWSQTWIYSKNAYHLLEVMEWTYLGWLNKHIYWCITTGHGLLIYDMYIYIYIWVNYNISLTWIKAIWGWFPILTMNSSEGEQWGRYNLPIYIYMCYRKTSLLSIVSIGPLRPWPIGTCIRHVSMALLPSGDEINLATVYVSLIGWWCFNKTSISGK